MIAGIGIGILIGIISGTVALLLLKTANTASVRNPTSVVAITTEILAIPSFWFGGPWVTSSFLNLVALQEMINPYIVTLASSFSIIMVYPIIKWVLSLANELGQEVGRK